MLCINTLNVARRDHTISVVNLDVDASDGRHVPDFMWDVTTIIFSPNNRFPNCSNAVVIVDDRHAQSCWGRTEPSPGPVLDQA